MITLNTNGPDPVGQSVRRVSEDAPKVVADAPKGSPAPDIKQADAPQASPQQLESAVKEINQALQQSNRNLQISVDTDTKRPVVRLVDTETGELIRQIPSEETLAISRSIDEFQKQQGLLFSEKA